MDNWTLSTRVDLMRPAAITAGTHTLMFPGDGKAHTIAVSVFNGSAPADISGAGVVGYCQRADGQTVPVTGSIGGNTAYVTLLPECYIVAGRMHCIVRLMLDDVCLTIAEYWFAVENTIDQSIIVPDGSPIQDENTLLQYIAQLEGLRDSLDGYGDRVDQLRSEMDEYVFGRARVWRDVTATRNGYITLNVGIGGTVNVNPVANSAAGHCIVPCVAGDQFKVRGLGGNASRLWGFTDKAYRLLAVSAANLDSRDTEIELAATQDGFFISNYADAPDSWNVKVYQVDENAGLVNEVKLLDKRVTALEISGGGSGGGGSGGSTEGLADLIQRVETLERKPSVTDAHINSLIDARLSPVESSLSTLADRAEEVSG